MFNKQIFNKEVTNEKEMEELIEYYILNGFKVVNISPSYVNLRQRYYGAASIHFVLYVFFLLFLSFVSVDSSYGFEGLQVYAYLVQYIPFAAFINLLYIIASVHYSTQIQISMVNEIKKSSLSKKSIPKLSSNSSYKAKKRFCKNCGSELKDDEDFCTECGTLSRVNNS